MPINEIKPFAGSNSANVTPQVEYESLPALQTGFSSGKASSAQVNKALRQSSAIASSIAQFVAEQSDQDVRDDGNSSLLKEQIELAIKNYSINNLPAASTSSSGISQLSSAIDSASETTAATSKAVKDAYEKTLGINQTWQDVTASRITGVNYTNTTGRSISIALSVVNAQLSTLASTVYVSGFAFSSGSGSTGEHRCITVIVPPLAVYSFQPQITTGYTIMELR